MRLRALLALALLAGCARVPPPAPAPATGFCRIGSDGGPLLAGDRGIGGTGRIAAAEQGDRGIGGTGALAAAEQGERGIGGTGIGGTGIVGVITGFASICVNGLKVEYDPSMPVEADGTAIPADRLRAGQLVIIEAVGRGDRLEARSLAVRHEVIGPVERVDPDGALQVAGQSVVPAHPLQGETAPRRGQWVAVSGLRRPDGSILATRLDPAPPGPVLVHGAVGAGGRIGALRLEGAAVPQGPAQLRGRYLPDGGLRVEVAAPDLLLRDPAAHFGQRAERLVVEAVVGVGPRGVEGAGGWRAPLAAARPGTEAASRAVLELRRQPDGGMAVTGLRGAALAPPPLGAGGLLGPVGEGRQERGQVPGRPGRSGRDALRGRPDDGPGQGPPGLDQRPGGMAPVRGR